METLLGATVHAFHQILERVLEMSYDLLLEEMRASQVKWQVRPLRTVKLEHLISENFYFYNVTMFTPQSASALKARPLTMRSKVLFLIKEF